MPAVSPRLLNMNPVISLPLDGSVNSCLRIHASPPTLFFSAKGVRSTWTLPA